MTNVNQLFLECKRLVDNNEYLKAKPLCKKLCKQNKNHHSANLMACIYHKLSKHKKAVLFLQDAIDSAINDNDNNIKELMINYLNIYRDGNVSKTVKKYLRLCSLYLIKYYERGELKFNLEQAFSIYMILLYDGDVENARKVFNDFPEIQYYKTHLINIPKLFKSDQEIMKYRREVADTLESINHKLDINLNENGTYEKPPPHIFPYVPFSFSYHGMNDAVLFSNLSNTYRRLLPYLNYDRPDCFQKRQGSRIKIGFISAFFKNHSVTRDRSGVIMNLPKDKFEVYGIYLKPPGDEYGHYLSKRVDVCVVIPKISINDESFINVRKEIGKLNLDILVYCEIGMDLITYCMAHSRLAPIQLSTWGHSDTSGISTIDYFYSSKYYEKNTANEHYSEKLVALPSLCTYYILPKYKPNPKFNYRDMGISHNDVLYICPQSLFKLNPTYRKLLRKILERDPNGYILCVDSTESYYLMDKLYSYFEDEFGPYIHRIRLLDRINPLGKFLDFMSMARVILDTYPFGGCNTSMEAFYINKVVITLPGDMLNGRFTLGFYQKMGIMDAVAKDADDYIEKVLYYAHNHQARQELENRISKKKYLLYREIDSVKTWSDTLQKFVKPYFEFTENNTKPIPNIMHTVFLGFKPFTYLNYLALKSGYLVNKPDKKYIYFSQTPPGDLTWWNAIQTLYDVKMEKMMIPSDSTEEQVKQKSYTLAIIKILEKGGIYYGANMLALKSMEKLLSIDKNTILGREETFNEHEGCSYNLFMGRKNSNFLFKWYSSFNHSKTKDLYPYFRRLPLNLSMDNLKDVHIEPEWSFSPINRGNNVLFDNQARNGDIDYYIKDSYCIQIWEKLMDKYNSLITPEYMKTEKNNFTRLFGKYVED